MKHEEMHAFIESLYSGGKKPCEQFGFTWEQLALIDKDLFSLYQPRKSLLACAVSVALQSQRVQ